MKDIYLNLAADAIDALVSGTELVVEVPDAGTTLFLRCDDATVKSFRQHIEKALLRLLPADKSIH